MASIAEQQVAVLRAPRRGAVVCLEVDSTARPYDLSTLNIGGNAAPEAGLSQRKEVCIWMQAQTHDVFFYFHTATANDLSDTAKISAGGAMAFDNAYGATLKVGNPPILVRIDRKLDRWLVVKAASTAGLLRVWAASDED